MDRNAAVSNGNDVFSMKAKHAPVGKGEGLYK